MTPHSPTLFFSFIGGSVIVTKNHVECKYSMARMMVSDGLTSEEIQTAFSPTENLPTPWEAEIRTQFSPLTARLLLRIDPDLWRQFASRFGPLLDSPFSLSSFSCSPAE